MVGVCLQILESSQTLLTVLKRETVTCAPQAHLRKCARMFRSLREPLLTWHGCLCGRRLTKKQQPA